MATNMTIEEQTSNARAPGEPDRYLQRYREKITAQLALGIVVIFGLCIAGAFVYIGDEEFTNVKDLLSLLTPIVGVVLGFYFNKASTEKRAESAEETAHAATEASRQANEERAQAQTSAAAATESLQEVTTAAEELLQTGTEFPQPVDDAAADDESGGTRRARRYAPTTETAARVRLEQAVERARRRM